MANEWVYVLDPEGWFELKDDFVVVPLYAFRGIGKASPWVPKRLFDAMLDEWGG